MAGKLPYIKFYPGDWLRDNVAGCSLAAQGLWLRMMFLAHDSDRYGHLSVGEIPMPPEQIARRCGATLEQYESLLAELTATSVPSRTPEGVIFSRRMVKDEEDRAASNGYVKRSRKKMKGKCKTNERSITEYEYEHESEPASLKKQCEEIYEMYPRKEARAKAITAIEKALKKTTREILIEAVSAFAKAKAGSDSKFIPHPATWFNEERWKDDRSNWNNHGANGQANQHQRSPGTHQGQKADGAYRDPGNDDDFAQYAKRVEAASRSTARSHGQNVVAGNSGANAGGDHRGGSVPTVSNPADRKDGTGKDVRGGVCLPGMEGTGPVVSNG